MSLVVDVKVVPASGRQEWVLDKSGVLKCFLKSAPEGGKANAELIAFIARLLGVPAASVAILLGAGSRKKRLKIEGVATFEELCERLGVEQQKKLV